MDNTINTPTSEQLKQFSSGKLWNQDELYARKIIFAGMKQRSVLNAYRELRIKLLEKSKTDNIVLLVSSISEEQDSSNFSYNLAATFALDQKKTALYVDCNPYSRSALQYITSEITHGLTNYLIDETIDLRKIIYPSGVDRVRVIPSGSSSEKAVEFFNSERMAIFVAEIKARYPDRFIVLDAPPVQSSTEARILSRYCDHAYILLPSGQADIEETMAAVDAVGKDKFAGIVFQS